MAALAKPFEEVFVPGRAEPVRIPRGSEALYLLQRIRDEAHRFAITYHRELRAKRMTRSGLEGVPGLGEARRKRLVREMGSVRAVRAASLDDLLAIGWLPEQVARALHAHLHLAAPGRARPGAPPPGLPGRPSRPGQPVRAAAGGVPESVPDGGPAASEDGPR